MIIIFFKWLQMNLKKNLNKVFIDFYTLVPSPGKKEKLKT